MNQEFDEIRPYYDEELPAIYEELIADPAFRQVAEVALPGVPFEMLAAQMRACKTKQEFQVAICYNILKRVIRDATQGVTFDNSAQPEKGGAYTYVSNHRDIVLDSGFLSMMLVEQGQDTSSIRGSRSWCASTSPSSCSEPSPCARCWSRQPVCRGICTTPSATSISPSG